MPNDLGQRMRAALDATIPDEEGALRRVARQRALRLARDRMGRDESPASGWLPGVTPRRVVAVCGVLGTALLVGFLVDGPWGAWSETKSVSIEPSLERDLQGQPRTARTASRAGEQKPPDSRNAIDEAGKLPAATPPEVRTSEKGLPATRAPLTPSPMIAPGGADAVAPGDADARWVRVTEAMRKGDWEAAKLALAPLAASDDPETKDSARLLRIRLELGTSGNRVLAPHWQEELSELAKSGNTSSIRASARRLLESTSGTPASDPELELPHGPER